MTSDGVHSVTAERVQALARATRAAGGLFVADEVQHGYGRSGGHLWGFARLGVEPDIVTLGKPMGNGYPVAAVIARKDIFDRFAAHAQVFSTFGGNPVAARAALAVLDVIEDERLVENAGHVGSGLLRALEELRARSITEVRGRGLLIGVELSDAATAERVVNALRNDGILIGRTGRDGNVLKLRPPLVFGDEHAELLIRSLARALDGN